MTAYLRAWMTFVTQNRLSDPFGREFWTKRAEKLIRRFAAPRWHTAAAGSYLLRPSIQDLLETDATIQSLAIGQAIRLSLFDRKVSQAIWNGRVDTVINLGCGFDTRPWRLRMPKGVTWVDVDNTHVLAEKTRVMVRFSNLPLQPTNYVAYGATAQEFIRYASRYVKPAARVLVISEGLISYLKPYETSYLASMLHRMKTASTVWLTDVCYDIEYKRAVGSRAFGVLERIRSPYRFHPLDPPQWFAARGWAGQFIDYNREGRRLGLLPPGDKSWWGGGFLLERQPRKVLKP